MIVSFLLWRHLIITGELNVNAKKVLCIDFWAFGIVFKVYGWNEIRSWIIDLCIWNINWHALKVCHCRCLLSSYWNNQSHVCVCARLFVCLWRQSFSLLYLLKSNNNLLVASKCKTKSIKDILMISRTVMFDIWSVLNVNLHYRCRRLRRHICRQTIFDDCTTTKTSMANKNTLHAKF